MTSARANENVRYEPNEHPPRPITIGAGIQAAMIIVAPVVLTVVIVARIAEQPESYITWGVFAALLISGITTVLQAVRVGRVGAGHVLIMGTSGAFIAVCVTALVQGGPATMASLIIVSSLFQFVLAARLSLLRRIFTPVVTGTVIMLIAVTVMPLVFDTAADVPEGSSSAAAPVVALATLVTVAALVLRAPAGWRLWSPLIGIVVGCAVGAAFGIYDTQYVLDAPWVGAPVSSWPGFDFTPGVEFLGAPAGVRRGHTRGRNRDRGRRRGYSTGLSTPPARDRLPGRPGRAQCGRRGQPAFRHRRNAAQHDLFIEHCTCRGHGDRSAARRRRHRRRVLGGGVLPKSLGAVDCHTRTRSRRLPDRSHRASLPAGYEKSLSRTASITARPPSSGWRSGSGQASRTSGSFRTCWETDS